MTAMENAIARRRRESLAAAVDGDTTRAQRNEDKRIEDAVSAGVVSHLNPSTGRVTLQTG